MPALLALVEAWWAESPLLTFFGVLAGAFLTVLLLLVLGILGSPHMRIWYRALRRLIWIKVGTTRHGPALPRRYRQHLDSKQIDDLLMASEGAAFGRTGVIYLTRSEIGFVSMRFGIMSERQMPFAQISEAKISKGALYDSVKVTAAGRAELLRIYRSDRDVGQEFFNHLQMRLGAMRIRTV